MSAPIKCPICGSQNISGRFASFFVPLDAAGEPIGERADWSANTELTEDRECRACEHEFKEDEQ